MTTAKTNTQTARLVSFLTTGRNITSGQAFSKFGIRNMPATASNLRRNQGLAVYANKRTTVSGNSISVWRLGTPSRAVVAAGYRALAAS